ncbi:ORF119 [Plodia interpunctella granulovirus]|uniref:ORF119 n=1 Tax=Plodia interpunctella granulovirus TaxID=262175 RepID=A0A1L5JGT1_9BBAC|nr:ORF119 [Plodia interpunctella granulovirus]APO14003.1 ORF119 [Plodia interpunctella granulovirus]
MSDQDVIERLNTIQFVNEADLFTNQQYTFVEEINNLYVYKHKTTEIEVYFPTKLFDTTTLTNKFIIFQ